MEDSDLLRKQIELLSIIRWGVIVIAL